MQIKNKYYSKCLSCGGEIPPDEMVYWEAGVGVWHTACPTPKSLDMLRREKEQFKIQRYDKNE